MRARILWAAALALLLFVLALGLSALAGAAEPRSAGRDLAGPRRPGLELDRGRIHAPGPVRRGGRLQRHLRLRGRWRRRRRHDPGHLLPLQPGQRAVGHVSAADAGRGGDGVRRLLPDRRTDLRLRRQERERAWSATPPGSSTSRRTRGAPSRTCLPRAPRWRPATTAPTGGSTWSAATAATTHRAPRRRRGSTTRPRTRSPRARRSRTQSAVPRRVSSTANSSSQAGATRPVRSSISSGTTAPRRTPGPRGPACRARPNARRQRRCEREALGLRRRDSVEPERGDCCLRSGRQ